MSLPQKKEPNGWAGPGADLVRFPGAKRVDRHNKQLIGEYQKSKDPRLLSMIVERNQGLLHTVLKRFSYFPDPYEDLLQVANLGLIKAAQRFELSRGIEFSSYATTIVDGEVRHYLRDSVLMRQPRWLRKLSGQIEEASIELTRTLKRTPTLKEIAEKVNVSQEGILEVLRVDASVGLHPLNDRAGALAEPEPDASRVHSLRYQTFSLPVEDRIVLEQALDALSSFQRKIVFLLFYRGLTQSEVAEEMGMTQRNVSRESAKALGRMKAILNTKIF
ncbi:MAG: sigma-70 family RNA polymerase sigma factor [Actinobacteria bacterium]|nr:sigma-70 family RNA polymerase sigma factor [Actinomycetota bacterium]